MRCGATTHSPPPTRSRCSCPTCAASWRPRVSRGCCTRSAEPATSSAPDRLPTRRWSKLVERVSVAFDRLPIRTRLAGVSALLTFTILCAFALVVGSLTVHRIRSNFNREVAVATANFASLLQVSVTGNEAEGFTLHVVNPSNLNQFASSEHAAVRILSISGGVLASTAGAPNFGGANETDADGYRVDTRLVSLDSSIGGAIVVQYARRLSDVEGTVARV